MDELAFVLALDNNLTAEDIAIAEQSATVAAASAAEAQAAAESVTTATTAETEAYLGLA